VVAAAGSLFENAGLPEDDLRVAKTRPAPLAAFVVRPGDHVNVTGGLHAGRQGFVVFVLQASGQYAKVELPVGLRTIPTRYLRKLPAAPLSRPLD
jgi:hypothetical protein